MSGDILYRLKIRTGDRMRRTMKRFKSIKAMRYQKRCDSKKATFDDLEPKRFISKLALRLSHFNDYIALAHSDNIFDVLALLRSK